MLKFASQEEALQHLSDLTGKKIKIAKFGPGKDWKPEERETIKLEDVKTIADAWKYHHWEEDDTKRSNEKIEKLIAKDNKFKKDMGCSGAGEYVRALLEAKLSVPEYIYDALEDEEKDILKERYKYPNENTKFASIKVANGQYEVKDSLGFFPATLSKTNADGVGEVGVGISFDSRKIYFTQEQAKRIVDTFNKILGEIKTNAPDSYLL
jgi:hypothetical protein